MDKVDTLTITPETKIGPLLDRFPALEATLAKMSPAYAKLQNPLLRKTVAKVATLQQVAKIGDVPIGKLINSLRKELGIEEQWAGGGSTGEANTPSWFDRSKVTLTLDATPILAAGEHPLNRVMKEVNGMHPGEIYELITPFVPAPLLDAVGKNGFEVWSEREPDGSVHSFFCRGSFEV